MCSLTSEDSERIILLQIKCKIITQAIWRRFLELQKYLDLDGINSYVWHRGIVWCRTEQGLTLMFVLIYLD